ncbi:TerD family protein [Dactylosporangium fulvum]|uniref:Tellurium resistance TerZ family protein n=1 Tax=Dactylosporangium fulvum TaxID=53359 RepID=A0ABY5VU60_9ACTN|nr:TerD family protein [Dactylosporangium fulvum]UWP80354.1 tellurium resistance TerZ family protein [Dactylosporangium fulvum]
MSVSLQKGQTVSLSKAGGPALTKVRMGLGWDAVKKRGLFGARKTQDIDLDASCLLFDRGGALVDQVWFRQLRSAGGAVQHTGDNVTGAGEGDDESIIVDLPALPTTVQTLVFVVNSFTGQSFAQVENAYCRLVNEVNGAELARYDLSGSGPHTAQVMCKVARDRDGWAMTAIGAKGTGRTFRDLLPVVAGHL